MSTLRWSKKALIDFDEAQSYIAHEDPAAARQVAERILVAARRLQDHPEIGRMHPAGARIWAIQRTPYLLVYRVVDDVVEILRLWHGRRNWFEHATD